MKELQEFISLIIDYRGKTPLKLGLKWSNSGYRALSAKNIKTGRIVNEDSIYYGDDALYKAWMKDEVQKGDILITSEAPFGEVFFWDSDEKIILSQRLFCLRAKNILPKYLYYAMTSSKFQSELVSRATGTTVTGLRQPELLKCKIPEKPIHEQQHIVDILGSIDEKIENNEKIIDDLERFAITEYQKISQDCMSVLTLGDIVDIFDNKRKPLSSRQRADRQGNYRYFGATGVLDYVNDYLFDGEYVLLAEDGTVIDANGYPIVQLVTGQFWVNNHAHIIQAKNGYTNYSLYVALKELPVKEAVTGAVQLKINQANLCALELPTIDPHVLADFNKMLEPIFSKIIQTREEIEKLNKLKQLYLQKFFG